MIYSTQIGNSQKIKLKVNHQNYICKYVRHMDHFMNIYEVHI